MDLLEYLTLILASSTKALKKTCWTKLNMMPSSPHTLADKCLGLCLKSLTGRELEKEA